VGFALRISGAAVTLAMSASSFACSGPGQYVWFNQLPPESESNSEYHIGVGDVISIKMLGHEDMSVRGRVRADGRIALPLIGEVEARGKRPSSLRAELEGRFKDYVVSPSVTLNVEESQPMTVVLLGEVTRPGAYTLEPNTRLVQALALGGGLTEFASRDSIFVVREDPKPVRIRFTFDAVSRNRESAADFPLHRGDFVVVE
jgi:polysaccharide export outer membrane protein